MRPTAHAGSPSAVETVIELPDESGAAVDEARRVVETTRAAGCYTLPADLAHLPARNPRLTKG